MSIVNPSTRRKVKLGGPTHRRLIARGIIPSSNRVFTLLSLPEGPRDLLLRKLPLKELMRLAIINSTIRKLALSESFWGHLKAISQDEYRELLVEVARSGWGRLWELLYYGDFNKMRERILLEKSYHQAIWYGNDILANYLLRLRPTGEYNRSVVADLGRLERAVKAGKVKQSAVLMKRIERRDPDDEEGSFYDIISVVAESAPNLEFVKKLYPELGGKIPLERDDLFLHHIVTSNNYPLLLEYDSEIGINWNKVHNILQSEDDRVAEYEMKQRGIEEVTPEIVDQFGGWGVHNKKLLIDYVKKYRDAGNLLEESWMILNTPELISLLPFTSPATIKTIRKEAAKDGHDYLVTQIDNYLKEKK